MTDDQLADAWDSFAEALQDVPAQRALRFLTRPMSPEAEAACARQNVIWQHHYNAMQGANRYGEYRGIRPGIFGLGITL